MHLASLGFRSQTRKKGSRSTSSPALSGALLTPTPHLGTSSGLAGKIGYVMLDVSDSASAQFEQGRIAGREEERNRIIKAYDEEVSSSMIAALFLIETAKSELEEAGLPQAEAVSKASDMLAETTEKIADVLSNRAEFADRSVCEAPAIAFMLAHGKG